MEQFISNLDRVKAIKQKIFVKPEPIKNLACLIDPSAIIDSEANFSQQTGAIGLMTVINYWQQAFPDVESIWQQAQETDDERVIINWQAKATHTGNSFFQIKPRGNPVRYSGTTIYEFNQEGKLIHYKSLIDIDNIKKQLLTIDSHNIAIKNLTIQQGTVQQLNAISSLLLEYRKFYNKKPQSLEMIKKFVRDRLANNNVTIFLAYYNEKAIGIAQLYASYSTLSVKKIWTLYDLYVDEKYRKQKVGQQLLHHCKKFAINDGAARIDLKTEHDNLAAKKLYKSFGFSQDKIFTHYRLDLE